jgi:hypothetical protein
MPNHVHLILKPTRSDDLGMELKGAAGTGLVGLSGSLTAEKTGQAPSQFNGSLDLNGSNFSTTMLSTDGGETSWGLEGYAGFGGGIDFSVENSALSRLATAISDFVGDNIEKAVDNIKTAISTAGCTGATDCGGKAQTALTPRDE